MTFLHFIIKNPPNKRYLQIALGATLIQFIIFKILYPFGDFFSDSYSYIYAAYANLDINIWPIGYSKFLRMFHYITNSDTALISFQYFFLELSALYLFFSILYFFNPSKWVQVALFIFLFFNPLFLYISNYVNSDPLFIALSIFWVVELLWVIQRPNLFHIIIQGILLFLCFSVRNNAYIYPFITIFAFSLSRLKLLLKILSASIGLILIIPFIMHTRSVAYKTIGTHQFSLFTGWQIANNALYIYDKISVDENELPSPQCKELDQICKSFFKKIPPEKEYRKFLSSYVGNFFIRQPQAPLKTYVQRHYKDTDQLSAIIIWGKVSPIFEEYGKYLIMNHPLSFARYFMLPNVRNYFLPPLEKLSVYNLGLDDVPPIVKIWFNYNDSRVRACSKEGQGIILFLFPSLFMVLNVFYIYFLINHFFRKKYKIVSVEFNKSLMLISILLVGNFLFTILATINVFRYQVFPMIVCFVASLLLLELKLKSESLNSSEIRKTKYAF